MSNEGDRIAIDELCALVDLPRRTVRYYIQEGLVDRPAGAKRGAYYTKRHVEQLMTIRTWQRAGLSLERIRELLSDEGESSSPLPPPRRRRPRDVTLRTHVTLGPGVELVIDPQEAGLSSEAVRAVVRRAASLIDEARKEDAER
ncbi:MAG: MerR family transcriptional regulator [Truepera sp.]|nr:MerR family transcriptional regulator [Truepera sp.]